MDISDWGALCKIQDSPQGTLIYPNFIYNRKAYLDPFSDIWVGDAQGYVASAFDYIGGDSPVMGEWIANAPSGIIANISNNSDSSQSFYAQIIPNRYGIFPYYISLEQYTYAWDSTNYPSDDDYIMIKLVLTNKGSRELKDIFIAIQTNWDIDYDDWEDDLMDWDSDRRVGFAYDSDGSDKTVVGLVLVSGKLASHNIVDLTEWMFTDIERSKLMSNNQIDDLSSIGKRPSNYLNIISSGPYNLSPNESVSVIYAFVAGQSLDEFRANVDSAIDRAIMPSKLIAIPDSQSVKLSWTKSISPDVVGYRIYRSKTSGEGYTLIGQVEANTYLDTSVQKGILNYYIVRAVTNDGRESKYSNEVASAPGTPPKSPSNLIVKIDQSGKPLLQWSKADEDEVVGYRIFRNFTGSAPWTAIATVDKSTQSFIDVNAYDGNTYYYTITSINNYNWISDFSNIVSIELKLPFVEPSNSLKDVKVVPQPCSTKVKFINL
ncbi:MAG: fibronectin type III domain-containing protein, partial [Candidatus Poribacteria bacterium]